MDPSPHPSSGSDNAPPAVPVESLNHEHGFTELSHSTWFVDTFGKDPYPMMERLAPHRIVISSRLEGILPSSVLGGIRHASSDWDGINKLLLHLSHRGTRDRRSREVIEGVVGDLPELEEQLRSSNPTAASSARQSSALPPAAVFPKPPVCEGRNDLVAEIAAGVVGQNPTFRSAILHGVGGIGKSTVALEVLHHLDVISRFRGRRFFVGCENLPTIDALVSRLLSHLAIDTPGRDAKAAIYEFATSSPALLVLDNFEDLWNTDGPATEPFLSSIGKDDGFNIIVTKRGRSDLSLPNTRGFPLDILDDRAALHAFIRHAGRGLDETSDPDLPTLVKRLDGYPLALVLLAHQYDTFSGVTARQLLATYERQRGECLKRGEKDSRETSLRASVELSLASKAMSTAGAKELCFLLSLLPDGAEDELIEAFLARIASRVSAAQFHLSRTKLAVVGAGLASVSAQRLLRMLAPLRELFGSLGTISPNIRTDARLSIREHTGTLVELSKGIFSQSSAEESIALRRQVTIQLGNLTEDLKLRLASEEPLDLGTAIQNAADLADFIARTVPFVPEFLSVAIDRARSWGLVQGEASCQEVLGGILRVTGRMEDARLHLHRAGSLHKEIGDQPGEARVMWQLGNLTQGIGDLRTAEMLFDSALAASEAIDSQSIKADALCSLGNLARQRGYYNAAEAHLDSARVIYMGEGGRVGEADCLRLLGDVAGLRGDFPAARTHCDDALAIHTELGNRLGEGHILRILGNVALQEGNLLAAQVQLEDALAITKEVGDWSGQANSLHLLGNVALERDDLLTARARFSEALATSKAFHNPICEGHCLRSLGILALRQGDLPTAQTCLSDALSMCRKTGLQLDEANVLISLGYLCFRCGELSAARIHLGDALTLSEDLDYASGKERSRRLLAEIAAQANADDPMPQPGPTRSNRADIPHRSGPNRSSVLRRVARPSRTSPYVVPTDPRNERA